MHPLSHFYQTASDIILAWFFLHSKPVFSIHQVQVLFPPSVTNFNFNFNSLINSETLLPKNRLLCPPLLSLGAPLQMRGPREKIGTYKRNPEIGGKQQPQPMTPPAHPTIPSFVCLYAERTGLTITPGARWPFNLDTTTIHQGGWKNLPLVTKVWRNRKPQ